ncbi:signaling peptide TAXIMIN 2-like [Silene latifolia]|uniref:signaling peptide TAXIMIN 2-like n=1 Tax=Silene latifolia TaxID=37657 RepID=UPI003D7735D9
MGECRCRPLGFLIGLPFALLSLVLSLIGAVVWIIGFVLSCCPCCCCCAGIADLAMELVKLPVNIIVWFIDKFPC